MVAAPELLDSVYNQVGSLINAYKKQSNREKRETNLKEMDCQLFLDLLNLFRNLKDLTSTSQMIMKNQEQIQKIANSIQMYSIFDGISHESCYNVNQTELQTNVDSAENLLGKVVKVYYK